MNKKGNIYVFAGVLLLIIGGIGVIIRQQSMDESRINESKMELQDQKAAVTESIEKSIIPEEEISRSSSDLYPIRQFQSSNSNFDSTRYICEDKKLVFEYEAEEGTKKPELGVRKLEIMPRNVTLETISPVARFMTFTFSKDCQSVYAIVRGSEEDWVDDLYKYDVTTGKYTKLTENLGPRWNNLAEAKPSPFFIYAISDEKLLVSFFRPTTGLDVYTNFTEHQIFNLTTKNFTADIAFSDDALGDWQLPPTILNFKTNILSNAIGVKDKPSDEKYQKFVRRNFNLITEKYSEEVSLDVSLINDDPKLEEIAFVCPSTDTNSTGDGSCLDDNIANLFPEFK